MGVGIQNDTYTILYSYTQKSENGWMGAWKDTNIQGQEGRREDYFLWCEGVNGREGGDWERSSSVAYRSITGLR